MSSGTKSISLRGTSGDDVFHVPAGYSLMNTSIDGGKGSDTLDLSNYSTAGVTIRVVEGYARGSSVVEEKAFVGSFYSSPKIVDSSAVNGTIQNVENLIGSSGNDFLSANLNGPSTRIDGGPGNDALQAYGNESSVLLIGGTGQDWFDESHAGSVLVGGTMSSTGVASGDGETDYFNIGPFAKILDFEVGIDKLIISTQHSMDSAFAAGTWVSDGAAGATLMVNGSAVVDLANVTPAQASSIPLGFHYTSENGQAYGGSGDDILELGSSQVDTVVIGPNSGNDLVTQFDKNNDVLQFNGGLSPTWSDTYVNGMQSLLGVYSGGSVTLTGLTTADLSTLHIQGVSGPPVTTAPEASAWSSTSDLFHFV